MRAFLHPRMLLAALLLSVAAVMPTTDAKAQLVALDVAFKLTDLDSKPLPGVPVRIVFGSEKDWRAPGAGHKIVTDAKGEARFPAPVMR